MEFTFSTTQQIICEAGACVRPWPNMSRFRYFTSTDCHRPRDCEAWVA